MTRKLEGGISIVDWGGTTPTPIVSDVRGALEANDVAGILVDMRDCKELLADHLEALTEAHRVCQDRNCRIGLFGVNDRLARLVEVSGLRQEIPDLLNGDEQQVVAAFRNGKQVTTASPELEFEIDLGGPTEEAMNAPTARFAPGTVTEVEPYSPTVDPRDDATQVYATPLQPGQDQSDEELLAVYWADLTSTGYVIGGDSADVIMNAVTTGGAPRSQPTEAPEEGVIDLSDDLPAPTQQFKTTLMPTFDLGEGSGDDWTATPTGAVEVDFGGASGLSPAGAGVFAGPGESDFSPVDTSGGAPPPGVLQALAQQQVPTELPSDSDETIMFQPGALDEALRQAGMAAAAAAPAVEDLDTEPAGHIMVPPEAAYGGDDSDETVMFQPGSLDMALLAEVAAAAGPEQAVAAPAVEAPPAPAGRPAGRSMPDGFEVEIRLFMHDFAVTSNLHLQVLDRFVKADTEILGRTDLQVATGGTRAQVIEIVDQFVQSRLVRRMRSPRIRGGSGFMFSPSPSTRNTVTRLLKMWQNPQDRQKVSGWLRGTM